MSTFDQQYLNSGLFYGPSPIIKVRFPTSWPTYYNGYSDTAGLNSAKAFVGLSPQQQQAVWLALGMWSNYINVQFVEGDGPGPKISFGFTPLAKSGVAFYPQWPWNPAFAGDVFFNVDLSNQSFFPLDRDIAGIQGRTNFPLALHEIGHALGLDHDGVTADTLKGASLPADQANTLYTVMSYTEYSLRRRAITPMLYDIAQLQQQYGANTAFNAGNTTYRFTDTEHPFSSPQITATPSQVLMTLWDGGGRDAADVDTIDASGVNTNVLINLHEGEFSAIGTDYQVGQGGKLNVGIAFGTAIENAKGGFGSDVLIGNDVGNTLEGFEGKDLLQGNKGADTLDGGGGDDTLEGGDGIDTYKFSGAFGHDTIADSDFAGKILIDGVEVAAIGTLVGKYAALPGKRTYDATINGKKYTYQVVDVGAAGKQLVISKKGDRLNTITIKNFDVKKAETSDFLGIKLDDTAKLTLAAAGSGPTGDGRFNANPFLADGFDAGTVSGSTQVEEKAGRSFVIYLNRPAAAGERIVLGLQGLADKGFKVIRGDATLDANGAVIDLAQGQTMVTFALVQDGDVDADASGSITATLQTAGGTATSNAWSLALKDTAQGTHTYNGDFTALLTKSTINVDRGAVRVLEAGGQTFVQDANGNLVAGNPGEMVVDNVIFGTAGGGNDIINGGLGNDLLGGGLGDDRVDGGVGDDMIATGQGNDTILGGEGKDFIFSASGVAAYAQQVSVMDDWDLWGRPEGVEVLASGSSWGVTRSNGVYTFMGPGTRYTDAERDYIDAGGGDDYVEASWGNDWARGGSGNDRIMGMAGNDILEGGAGDDDLLGDSYMTPGAPDTVDPAHHGADFVDGGDGNDTIRGGGQGDQLFGGAGNDSMYGDTTASSTDPSFLPLAYHGADDMHGEDGDDFLMGNGGDDALYGGAGRDVLWGDTNMARLGALATDPLAWGKDLLDGGAGDDSLYAGGGDDLLFGGDDNDFLAGDETGTGVPGQLNGDDYLDGGAGTDTLVGGGGADILYGGSGNDVLRGDDSDSVVGGAYHGADYLDGEDGDDTLIGGGGADQLVGGAGNDVLRGDDVTSALPESFDGDDDLDGADGNDTLYGGGGKDTLRGGMGADVLRGEAGDDRLQGDAGDDVLYGDAGKDVLMGGDGNDSLYGGDDDDTLEGGAGVDYLDGGTGRNTYILGDLGTTTTEARTTIVDSGGMGVLVFSGAVTADTVSYVQAAGASDFALRYGSGDLVYIDGGLTSDTLSEVHFADGTAWTRADVMALAPSVTVAAGDTADSLQGGFQSDNLSGGGGDDRLAGGKGNDTLSGGLGSDTYVFNVGDGLDVIQNYATDSGAAVDTLRFGTGINATDVEVFHIGNDLVLGRNDQESVTMKDYYTPEGRFKIDRVVFADGSTWDQAALEAKAVTMVKQPTTGNDTLQGLAGDDEIHGLAGDDMIYGLAGDDRLFGDEGLDYLVGNDGNDYLDAGVGSPFSTETSAGGLGSDTFFFKTGYGQLNLNELSSAPGDVDTLLLGPEVMPSSVGLYRVGPGLRRNLQLVVSPNDVVTVLDFFGVQNDRRLERVQFADGTVWTADWIMSVLANRPTLGNNSIDGFDWSDTIDGLAGRDTIRGWGGNDSLYGGAGIDALYGGDGNDYLDGGAEDDTLYGDAGADTYFFTRGYGRDFIVESGSNPVANDTIRLGAGVTSADFKVYDYGTSVVLSINGSTDELWVDDYYLSGDRKVETITFDNNSSIQFTAAAWVAQSASAITSTGGTGNDTFVFNNPGDRATEATGQGTDAIFSRFDTDLRSNLNVENLTLTGPLSVNGYGNDLDNVLRGNDAHNTLWGLKGNDTIYGGGGNDSLSGHEGNDFLQGDDGNDLLDGGDGSDQLYGGAGNDDLDGGNGTDTIYGGAGNDTLRGTSGDVLYGGAGDDVYYIPGFTTTAQVVELAGEGVDTIVSNWGTGQSELWGQIENLRINPDRGTGWSTETLTGNALDNWLTGSDIGDTLDGRAGADTMVGGRGNDTFYVDNAGDVVIDNGGTDTVIASLTYTLGAGVEKLTLAGMAGTINGTGNNGNNVIIGTVSANVLDGGAGDDRLIGNQGMDTLIGGVGSDTYVISQYMSAYEVLVDNAAGDNATTTDTIELPLASYYYSFARQGDDLLVHESSSGAIVRVKDQYALSQDKGVDRLHFTDTFIDRADFSGVHLTQGGTLSGSLYNDVLTANAGGATLLGSGGNDTLAAAADGSVFGLTFDAGRGDDVLTGSYAGDTYRFRRGDGQDVITDDVRSLGSQGVQAFFAQHPNEASYQDSLEFEDIASTEVTARRAQDSADLLLSLAGSADQVRIRNWFDGTMFAKIESMQFADGVRWLASDVDTMAGEPSPGLTLDVGNNLEGSQYSDTLTGKVNGARLSGGAGRDTLKAYADGGVFNLMLDGGAGDDALQGSYAGDTYVYRRGDGNDTITDDVRSLGNAGVIDFFGQNPNAASYQDLLNFAGIASSQMSARKATDAPDLILSIAGGGEVRVRNWFDGTMFGKIERLQFSDGVSWSANDVDHMSGEASPGLALDHGSNLVGSQYDDALTATVGGAQLQGGAGRDTLQAHADGSVFGVTFDGGTGDDVMTGSYAGDAYVFRRGDGHDLIDDDVRSLNSAGVRDYFVQNPNEASYQDVLRFEDIASTDVMAGRSGDDLVLAVAGSDDAVTIRHWFDGTMFSKIEKISFADGVTRLASDIDALLGEPSPGVNKDTGSNIVGSQYNDVLTSRVNGGQLHGGAGRDTLQVEVNGGVFNVTFEGGTGNDTLHGSYAGDTYQFNRGDGNDLIVDDVRSLGSNGVDQYFTAHPEDTAYQDHLVFGAAVHPEDVSWQRWGNDMVFVVAGAGGSVTVQNWFDGTPYARIEKIDFAGGVTWSGSQLQ